MTEGEINTASSFPVLNNKLWLITLEESPSEAAHILHWLCQQTGTFITVLMANAWLPHGQLVSGSCFSFPVNTSEYMRKSWSSSSYKFHQGIHLSESSVMSLSIQNLVKLDLRANVLSYNIVWWESHCKQPKKQATNTWVWRPSFCLKKYVSKV